MILNVGSGESFKLNNILDNIKFYLPCLKVNYIDSKKADFLSKKSITYDKFFLCT